MNLPRWTVYPALALIGGAIVMALPRPVGRDPYAISGEAGAPATPRSYRVKPLVILGIVGMDPDVLKEVLRLYPDDMPNFAWLAGQADGIQSLGTSTPPQSPVAWSNFITGQDPGGHGIFDFIHRDPATRTPVSSTTKEVKGRTLTLPGSYQLTIGADSPSNRSGASFWGILREHGVPADIWRMPANFPVEPSRGLSFSGMMTPALDSAYGQCSFYTTDPTRPIDYEKRYLVSEFGGRIDTQLVGPPNSFKEHAEQVSVPVSITLDKQNDAALIDVGSDKVVLRPGQWSDFLEVGFDLLPLGMMDVSGIVRFYLRSIQPEFELYASPVNLDPLAPATPVSLPESASSELAETIGRYYTQGMAEDVNALKYDVLTDAEFMRQAELVFLESKEMLDYALDRYLEDEEGGLLFFYLSAVDLPCHMMWRHYDGAHPAHDPELAAQDSSAWSGRPGSTWRDTVHDLYRRMDPVLGRIRERLGDEVTLIVMSDHGFAPYRRKFDLNRWLWENGYLVLKGDMQPEASAKPAEKVTIFQHVDWSRTKAYGMGFNGLYLNLRGRELDVPRTPEDESGIVAPGAEADALRQELKQRLEACEDPMTGLKPVLRCDIARDVYHGQRVDEAPDILVGFNAGYGNSDAASTGRITNAVLQDNTGGTFNGSHLMAPDVVAGLLLTNRRLRQGAHSLEDLTVEILRQYGVEKPEAMRGHPVFE